MKYLNLILVIFLFGYFAKAQSVMTQNELNKIVKKEITKLDNERSEYASRSFYLLIDEKDYKLEVLKSLVETYSVKYPSPKILAINVLTEEKGLNAKIFTDTGKAYAPSIGDGERSLLAAKAYYEKHFAKITGYYASYLRHHNSESLLYTVEKGSEDFIKVDLKAEKLPKKVN